MPFPEASLASTRLMEADSCSHCLRLSQDAGDSIAWRTIISFEANGFGLSVIAQIEKVAEARHVRFALALREHIDDLPQNQCDKLVGLRHGGLEGCGKHRRPISTLHCIQKLP